MRLIMCLCDLSVMFCVMLYACVLFLLLVFMCCCVKRLCVMLAVYGVVFYGLF